jgi:hypothetical protein
MKLLNRWLLGSITLAMISVGLDALLIATIRQANSAGLGDLVRDGSILGACFAVSLEWYLLLQSRVGRLVSTVRQAYLIMVIASLVAYFAVRLDFFLTGNSIWKDGFATTATIVVTPFVAIVTGAVASKWAEEIDD